MKNIHVLPTDKPSRLHLQNGNLVLHRLQYTLVSQHIYITNDEEIKEGDWYWLEKIDRIGSESGAYKSSSVKVSKLNTLASNCKKIILTTDQDLIKDGVQAIDDEFLEWFVKNPSCEFVETKVEFIQTPDNLKDGFYYKIIIPQKEQKRHLIDMMRSDEELGMYDEPKQEIIMNSERIKEIQQETAYPDSRSVQQALLKVWNECEQQNKNLYSEEEVLKLLHNYRNHFELYRNIQVLPNDFFEWFEQFKKK